MKFLFQSVIDEIICFLVGHNYGEEEYVPYFNDVVRICKRCYYVKHHKGE